MKLSKQRAQFLAVEREGFKRKFVAALVDAHGMVFRCPGEKCQRNVTLWFNREGAGGELPAERYELTGEGLDDITIEGVISPGHRCGWSGTITAGELATTPAP